MISARSGHPGSPQRTWARRAAAAAAAGLLVALSAGCGGGGNNDMQVTAAYETKLKNEGSRLKTAFSAADIGEAENFKALAKALEHLQSELDRTAHDLEALDAPKNAAADDAKLAVVYRKAAAKVGLMARAAAGGHEQRLDTLNEQTDGILAQGRVVVGDLKAKGYEVGVLGEH